MLRICVLASCTPLTHLSVYLCSCSRDIAKLRLQEAKAKEQLEASRLRAEQEMRDNRLRTLELKAAVARAPRSPYLVGEVAENTRHNRSIVSSGGERIVDNAPLRTRPIHSNSHAIVDNSSSRTATRNHQGEVVADVSHLFLRIALHSLGHMHSAFFVCHRHASGLLSVCEMPRRSRSARKRRNKQQRRPRRIRGSSSEIAR